MSAQIYNPNGIIHYTSVDFAERNISVPIHVVKGDDSLPLIDVELLANWQPYIVPDGADVNFRMRKNDGTYVYNPVLGLNESRTHAYISITAQTAACAGDYEPDLEVVLNSKVAGSSKFKLLVDKSNIEGIESANELQTLYAVIADAKTVAENIDAVKTVDENIDAVKTVDENIDAVKTVDANISVIKASPDNALKSEGYSSGTQNGTEVKDGPYYKNNAAYYLSMVKAIAESITGLIPLNTSTFEALPPIAEVVIGGMYNISDDFTTTAEFEEGTGIKKDAGTNIYKTKGGKWDCLSGNTITKNEFNALALRVTALETLIGDLKTTGVTGDTASDQIKQINTGFTDKINYKHLTLISSASGKSFDYPTGEWKELLIYCHVNNGTSVTLKVKIINPMVVSEVQYIGDTFYASNNSYDSFIVAFTTNGVTIYKIYQNGEFGNGSVNIFYR